MGYRGDLCVGSRASLPGDLMVVKVSTELLLACFSWILESGREQNSLFCFCRMENVCVHTYMCRIFRVTYTEHKMSINR